MHARLGEIYFQFYNYDAFFPSLAGVFMSLVGHTAARCRLHGRQGAGWKSGMGVVLRARGGVENVLNERNLQNHIPCAMSVL